MNVYLLIEDGESFCMQGKTMSEVINLCEQSYLEDREEEVKSGYNKDFETNYYHEEILQSCSLVGLLKN